MQTKFDSIGAIRDDKGRFVKGFRYYKATEFTTENNSGKNNYQYGKPGAFLGCHHTEEAKIQISETEKGCSATSGSFKKGHEVPKGWRDAVSNACYKGCGPLYRLLYGRLYDIWTKPILERDNFTCQKCGQEGGKLQVHHNKETLAEIIFKFVSKFAIDAKDLSTEKKKLIRDQILKYHASGKVSGITLCIKCHKKAEKEMRRTKQLRLLLEDRT